MMLKIDCFERGARMRFSFLVFFTLALCQGELFAAPNEAVDDAELRGLIAQISNVSEERNRVVEADQQLLEKLNAFKGAAVPYLVPLLQDKVPKIRDFAGKVLRTQEGVTEQHLEALIAAEEGGIDWVAPAIARIGTQGAIQYLIDKLTAKPESNTQLTYALEVAGDKAVPQLTALFKAPTAISPDLATLICSNFQAAKSDLAVNLLLEIVQDQSLDRSNRIHAVESLGCVGLMARRGIPVLQFLASADPASYRRVVDHAVIDIGSPEAVPVLVATLREKPDVSMLQRIAGLRDIGRSAGPDVMALLGNENPDVALAAARALAYIDYREGADSLIPLLSAPDDWRLAYVAAESLGRLADRRAIPILKDIGAHHWYSPVARAANFAVKVLSGEDSYSPLRDDLFYAYEHVELNDMESSKYAVKPVLVRQPGQMTVAELKHLQLEKILGKRSFETPGLKVVGLNTASGYIVGIDHGEWGGDLYEVRAHSGAQVLLYENTSGVYRLPFGILAVTGLAHMWLDHGALYLVSPVEGGGFKATFWKTLPGGPGKSGMLRNGNVFIETASGDVIVTRTGQLKMATAANTTARSEDSTR
jgi:HEAT repeat protein